MINHILFDFSRVLLFPKDINYKGKLNGLYREIIQKKDYHFWDYFDLNTELIGFAEKLKTTYTLAIFTTEIIQNDPAIKGVLGATFSHIYVANDLGVRKKETATYYLLAEKLICIPENILFIDDKLANIQAALNAGVHVIQYYSNQQTIASIRKILKMS